MRAWTISIRPFERNVVQCASKDRVGQSKYTNRNGKYFSRHLTFRLFFPVFRTRPRQQRNAILSTQIVITFIRRNEKIFFNPRFVRGIHSVVVWAVFGIHASYCVIHGESRAQSGQYSISDSNRGCAKMGQLRAFLFVSNSNPWNMNIRWAWDFLVRSNYIQAAIRWGRKNQLAMGTRLRVQRRGKNILIKWFELHAFSFHSTSE